MQRSNVALPTTIDSTSLLGTVYQLVEECDPELIYRNTLVLMGADPLKIAEERYTDASVMCYMDFLNSYYRVAHPKTTDEAINKAFAFVQEHITAATINAMGRANTDIFHLPKDKEHATGCRQSIYEAGQSVMLKCTPLDHTGELANAFNAILEAIDHIDLAYKAFQLQEEVSKATTRTDKLLAVDNFAQLVHHGGPILDYACREHSGMSSVAENVLTCLSKAK